jgi:hypothetical protein
LPERLRPRPPRLPRRRRAPVFGGAPLASPGATASVAVVGGSCDGSTVVVVLVEVEEVGT